MGHLYLVRPGAMASIGRFRSDSAAYERGLRHPDCLAHWARALHSAGDVEKAVQVGELLLAMAPHSPHKGYVALLYQDFGNKERARALAQEALHAQSRAEKAEQLKTRFMANISHDLRSPLNIIAGYAESLLEAEPGRQGPGR